MNAEQPTKGGLRDTDVAHLALRIVLGVNIASHGVARVAHAGGFAAALVNDFAGVLPAALVWPFAVSLPFLELGIGIGILAGIRLRAALFAGALVIGALTFGMTLKQQWEIVGFQLVYAIAYFFLLRGASEARFTADAALARYGASAAPSSGLAERGAPQSS